ncbi:Beta-Galactoside Alpha-2,6-Sialyltransferase 1 [Manis pentadactyla]|nr:Beta-Galactoside Alpha-2,6-Sialyltransferase 1 [Manis pentadactyla]
MQESWSADCSKLLPAEIKLPPPILILLTEEAALKTSLLHDGACLSWTSVCHQENTAIWSQNKSSTFRIFKFF